MVILAVFHSLMFMVVWSLLQAMLTDPGQVPVFWGFHLGDSENKRRRYCLMCNVFKPERCHHCSACNRCVLNMDHHCPWINNCIGYWNRKYFMLLLIYVLCITYFICATTIYDFGISIKWTFDSYFNQYSSKTVVNNLTSNLMIQACFIMTTIIAGLITVFLKFHIMLVSTNMTTLENLD